MKYNLKNFIKKLNYKYFLKNGKNNQGYITVRHKGNGYKKKYLLKDDKKFFFNIPAILIKIFNKSKFRNKFYGLFLYSNGIILIHNLILELKIGNIIYNSNLKILECLNGNSCALRWLPNGTSLNNLELKPGLGSQICKTPRNFCMILKKNLTFQNRILIKLKNKKRYYLFNINCLATIGINFFFIKWLLHKKKAGVNRWLGIRPSVRGVAMNPIDHPHGGGQGKTSGGRCSVSPWSILTKGKKTKKKKIKYFLKKVILG